MVYRLRWKALSMSKVGFITFASLPAEPLSSLTSAGPAESALLCPGVASTQRQCARHPSSVHGTSSTSSVLCSS